MHFYFFFSLVILYARIYTIVEKEKACGFGNIYEGWISFLQSKSSSPFSLFFLFLREMLNPEFDGKRKREGEISHSSNVFVSKKKKRKKT